jgi:hypothetical protein
MNTCAFNVTKDQEAISKEIENVRNSWHVFFTMSNFWGRYKTKNSYLKD